MTPAAPDRSPSAPRGRVEQAGGPLLFSSHPHSPVSDRKDRDAT
jgi:hypothetical protein